jgi:hypothetical protein
MHLKVRRNYRKFKEQKIMTKFWTVLVFTFCVCCLPNYVLAQRKPLPKPTPKKEVSLSEIEATTREGKKVILLSDGTWKYSNLPSEAKVKSPVAKADATLSLETGIIYQSGEVIPVARTTFYLLDEDILSIAKKAGLQPSKISSSVYKDDIDNALIFDIGSSMAGKYQSLYTDFAQKFLAALEPHIIQKFTTDFSGKATVNNLERKSYYLFGVGATRKSSALWNLPIDLSKETSIVLDQKNATRAF